MKFAKKVQKALGIQTQTNEQPARRKLTQEDKLLAQRIKRLRKVHNWTQEELSDLLAMNTEYIKKVEAGHQGLSLPMIYRLAKVFHISLKDLFSFEHL